MAVMDEEISSKRGGREVVNAAGAVGYIAEDEAVSDIGEGSNYVRKDERVHQEPLRELESNSLSSR